MDRAKEDLISRKAAIDALNDEFTIIGKTNAIVVQDYIRRVNNRLHDLPSAQPEPCEDAVSRKAVEYLLAHFVSEDKYVDAINDLRDLPSVTPKVGTQMSLPECGDAISRKDAIDALENMSANYTKPGDREWHPHMDFVVETLEKLPSVTPKMRTGKWKHERLCSTTGGTYPVTRCSTCQCAMPFEWEAYYCPSCGAKMEGAEQDG